jgi:plastocyanin
VRVRAVITAAAAAALLLLGPTVGAEAATAPVNIDATGFDPAVVVVAPGAKVEWTNRDLRSRALRGEVESPAIAPGKTFVLRLPRPGVYEYHDRDNPLLTGTVIVAAGSGRGRPHYPSPAGPRIVTHSWRASLRIDLREAWKYMDGKFLSFDGRCNAQVGGGSRTVGLRATFPSVEYDRIGKLELLTGRSKPYRIQRYRETIDSKTSDPSSGRIVDCGDGSFDPPADVEQKCDHDFAGTRVRAELSWSPKIGQGRLHWPHAYLGSPPREENCGHGLLAGSVLAGLDMDQLAWDPGPGTELLYEHGRTNPLTAAEVRALRGGRAVTIERSFELQFTADCCLEWHEQGKPGTYVRVGARHEARGRVTLRFTPR